MRAHLLDVRIPWLGAHAGYTQLAAHLSGAGVAATLTACRTSHAQIRLGRLYARARGWRWRTDFVAAAGELRFALRARLRPADLLHVLYAESHHPWLERWAKAPRCVVATLHHPPVQWPDWHPSLRRNLARLSSAIVLWRRDLTAFEDLVGPGRVRFVHHGVDTDFFRPAEPAPDAPPRLVYAGQNGRDTAMLVRVVERLAGRHPGLRVDLLVRREIRHRFADLARLADHPCVDWHDGISDEALRALYRRATALLLPLTCAGAVNTILEALACGLPVVTTDVGGVSDYGGGSIYPTVAAGDDDAMVALVERYLSEPAWRAALAGACREFAVSTLAWPVVAAAHGAAYRALLAA